MNKSRAIAFVVATIVSTATIGGAQAASPRAPGSARAGQAANAGRHQKGLLRGVQLTDAEKSALKEVHGRYRSRSQSLSRRPRFLHRGLQRFAQRLCPGAIAPVNLLEFRLLRVAEFHSAKQTVLTLPAIGGVTRARGTLRPR